MKVIVGLGNPGPKYKQTRHNVGFMVIDYLVDKYNAIRESNRQSVAFPIPSLDCYLVKPLTFMNNSGLAVREIVNYKNIDVEDILVVYDDMSLPSGKLRFRQKGSAGGHNGIKSIINHLHTSQINRLKVGIGGDNLTRDVHVSHVLGKLSKKEISLLNDSMADIEDGILDWVKNGISFTMNKYN